MRIPPKKPLLLAVAVAAFASSPALAQDAAQPYIWQQDQANVTETGDIEWTPKPFRFEAGEVVRYIDFENGNDDADGTSKDSAWKRHPWDRNATGQAAAHEGPTTYVFRRGVVYRGGLGADESGEPGNPIILTASATDKSSPHYWGEGEAMLFGSRQLPARWVKATEVEYPARIPNPDAVWALDIKEVALMKMNDKTGEYELEMEMTETTRNRGVAMPFIGFAHVDKESRSHWQHLARTPDWQPGNENFVIDYWHQVESGSRTDETDAKGKPVQGGLKDTDVLKGHPEDFFEGGYIWPQYAHFMGTPKPKRIKRTEDKRGVEYKVYDPEKGALQIGGIYGGFKENLRYMIEGLPQYLDAEREFYFDAKTGTMFYIPPQGESPNEMQLELTSVFGGIDIPSQSNILINGLDIRHFDGSGILMEEDVENVTVRNCRFDHLVENGLTYRASNWRGGKPGDWANNIRVTDCLFTDVNSLSLNMTADPHNNRRLGHVEILRNQIYNNGMRHKDNVQSSVEALAVRFPETGVIAGNIVERSFGSGIQIFTGAELNYQYPEQSHTHVANFPLVRVHIFQNKTVDTALGVNDYGGFSLWQGGVQYCYNNNIGNSPGVMPAGIGWFNTPPTNLSYPLYLDGAYKIYSFNNVVWARSNNLSLDPYATKTPGYFMVFGFLNQLSNNTFYRTGSGVGGSAGHRNDVISNLFAEVGTISKQGNPDGKFIANDRTGDPSLVGGGDTGESGRRGVPTLAFAHNLFHGPAEAGRLLKPGRFAPDSPGIEADTIAKLSEEMLAFPIRYGQLGWKAEEKPIIGKGDPSPVANLSEVSFQPSEGSMAIDKGATYFVPWALHGTVGEWHFTENLADPRSVIDYAWYMAEPHYHRMMYEFVPSADLLLNEATLEDYAPSPSEDWTNGAMIFDGERYASVSDGHLRADIVLAAYPVKPDGEYGKQREVPQGPFWQTPEPLKGKGRRATMPKDANYIFPGEHRRTLAISTENILLEANLKTEERAGVIMGKHDGKSGYQLALNGGKPVFTLSSEGKDSQVASDLSINDGNWHHVIAEVDRKTGRMTVYVDGKKAGEGTASLASDASVDNGADFLVARAMDGGQAFVGEIDYMRVCHGTLADALTTIDELYAWQTNGPWKYDMRGQPIGGSRRDVGAIETR